MDPKKAMGKNNSEAAQFFGWIAVLLGTWMVASTLRELLLEYLPGTEGPMLTLIIGFVLIGSAVAFFGKQKPWRK